MPVLNESLVFIHEPESVQAAFVGKAARRTLLPAGLELYKFTGFDVTPGRAGAHYSPWWAAVQPLAGTPDPGLDGHVAAARASGLPMLTYAREAFAVMLGWNALALLQSGLAKVVRIGLTQPVYGFGGSCQRMREAVPAGRVVGRLNVHKSPLNPPTFRGGAYQFYVPNLTAAHLRPLGSSLIP
ncbi:MAG TPA: hypothetical protein VM597_41410 [Gemmataceae bacterium]|nr:hypothetical protein [Gemmataceae bacterium]